MPGPGTIITLGAVGAAGAAAYVNNRRNSMGTSEQNAEYPLSPHAMARRRSSTVMPDHSWEARKQAEYHWRRNYGASFSHNSHKSFPSNINQLTK
ncbi:uncharacterized protein BYT42DRAFT_615173 [Radiomyces spectabilis]|uniref:uncharacterized protein n=1 Tax=Radiomyces spectabilis TaxID=64574 RepID=UPI00221F8141|nr:uncharacterized protein BYT42DRAFT_615173 [Radiomyces spectabilis]KAI8376435.1 hypothetical protein BYT42DRAFT_615173 [Radiomyces spectabilis]